VQYADAVRGTPRLSKTTPILEKERLGRNEKVGRILRSVNLAEDWRSGTRPD
jgi:hypothetical protein